MHTHGHPTIYGTVQFQNLLISAQHFISFHISHLLHISIATVRASPRAWCSRRRWSSPIEHLPSSRALPSHLHRHKRDRKTAGAHGTGGRRASHRHESCRQRYGQFMLFLQKETDTSAVIMSSTSVTYVTLYYLTIFEYGCNHLPTSGFKIPGISPPSRERTSWRR